MTKKKIFITGISSDLMQQFVGLIDRSIYQIIGLSRQAKPTESNDIEWIEGDLKNIDQLPILFEEIDMIVHAAAITHSMEEQKYFEINTEATKRLVDLAKKAKVKHFVFVSSRTAGYYSGAYGLSKLTAEHYIQKELSSWLIFRPSEVFGVNKNEGIEELIKNVLNKPYVLCPIQVESPMFPVFLDDVVQIMYDYAFEKMAENQVITINGNQGYSFKEVIQLTKKVSKRNVLILPVPKFAMMMVQQMGDKFIAKLGIAPDQIARLYSKKLIQKLDYDFYSLEEYVISLIDQDKKKK